MTTATAPSLRERKKAATREALQVAALRLALRDGLDALTVEAIADACDVSPRTFFNYFGSKEEALLPSDPSRRDALTQTLIDRPASESSLRALQAVISQLAADLGDRREETQQRMQLVRENPGLLPRHLANFASFERALVLGVATRTGQDPDHDLFPSLAATTAIGVLRTSVQVWRTQGASGAPLATLVDRAFDALAAGLPDDPHPASRRPAAPLTLNVTLEGSA